MNGTLAAPFHGVLSQADLARRHFVHCCSVSLPLPLGALLAHGSITSPRHLGLRQALAVYRSVQGPSGALATCANQAPGSRQCRFTFRAADLLEADQGKWPTWRTSGLP